MGKLKWPIFVLFLGLGAIFRFAKLDALPFFDGDEAALGYDAYSLERWGTDEYKNKLPLYFRSTGDFKYPTYVYMSTVWAKLFGLSEFSARFTSAISGMLAIVLIYVIVRKFGGNELLSLTTAAFMAGSAWHIMLSRKALEANLGLTLILLSVACAIVYIKDKKKNYLLFLAIFVVAGFLAYSAVRLFLMVVLGCVLVDKRVKNIKLKSVLGLLIGVGIILSIDPQSRARASNILIWYKDNLPKVQVNIDEDVHANGIAQPREPIWLTRIFHNKPVYIFDEFMKQLVAQFNPNLWLIDAKQEARFSLEKTGFVTMGEFAAIGLGTIAIIRSRRQNLRLYMVWILAAIVPSALIIEPPHLVRLVMLIPAVCLLGATGIVSVKNVVIKLALVMFISVGLLRVGQNYVILKNYSQPWIFEMIPLKIVSATKPLEAGYEHVVYPKSMSVYYLFKNKEWSEKSVFEGPNGCPRLGKTQVLYVCVGVEIPKNGVVKEVIRYADGVAAATLVEFVPRSQMTQRLVPQGFAEKGEIDPRFGSEGIIPGDYPEFLI